MRVCVCEKTPHTPNTTHKASLGAGDKPTGKHIGPVWVLAFHAVGDGPPIECRIRQLLKVAIRSFGLRCRSYAVCPVPAALTGRAQSSRSNFTAGRANGATSHTRQRVKGIQ
jgi:hypothetical protein